MSACSPSHRFPRGGGSGRGGWGGGGAANEPVLGDRAGLLGGKQAGQPAGSERANSHYSNRPVSRALAAGTVTSRTHIPTHANTQTYIHRPLTINLSAGSDTSSTHYIPASARFKMFYSFIILCVNCKSIYEYNQLQT